MILLATTFVLMVCTKDGIQPSPNDPRACVPLEETYDAADKCEDAIKDLTKFWLEHMGELPQLPMHCESELSNIRWTYSRSGNASQANQPPRNERDTSTSDEKRD